MNDKVEKVEQSEGVVEEESSMLSVFSGKKAMFVYQMLAAALFLGLLAFFSKYLLNGVKLF
jgi:hypothetical protein